MKKYKKIRIAIDAFRDSGYFMAAIGNRDIQPGELEQIIELLLWSKNPFKKLEKLREKYNERCGL